MATEVVMPKQGNSVEACILLEWKVKVGDSVSAGDVICEAETDKSTIEVESTAEGNVLTLLWSEGDEVPVMQPILVLGAAGEVYDGASAQKENPVSDTSSEPSRKTDAVVKEEPLSVPQSLPQSTSAVSAGVSPRAKSRATKDGISLDGVIPTGPKGRIIERDVRAASSRSVSVSPAARAVAQATGAAVPQRGSGIAGRILLKDLISGPAEQVSKPSAEKNVIPVKGIRKVTAQRMKESIDTTAAFTLNTYADARGLIALRKKFKESSEELGLSRISINDMVMFAVSRTLISYPYMNAHFFGETITEYENVHLGFAVDTPKGLLVPVLPYAELHSLKELSDTSKHLANKAIDGKAQMEELSGSTFTVSNLGALGIDTFSPVINIPEVAILGVGEISLKPIGTGGEDVSFVPHIGLSLTINHMAVDGAPGSRFLKALTQNIADIELMLAL
ncbi:MAG: 2-oxo acid dehydrogenase subunit E2 [Sphaerochaetaceae bacterium]|nr:2-oxo acid dehydrogenase subunit E2 [Sphaerochaetaceae bacterium]